MNILQLMQLSTAELKNRIKSVEQKSDKNKLISAMILKTVSTVGFAIIMITALNAIFSSKNTSVAIVIFCLVLAIRFVNYGYKVRDSIISLLIIFAIFAFAPMFATNLHPIISFIVNFSAVFIILFLTCDNPYMGNASLYVFSYIFISGFPVQGVDLALRVGELLLGWIICSIIFYIKHKTKFQERGVIDLIKEFRFSCEKYQWEFLVAIGISTVIVIGYIFKVPRPMWIGFACSSILCTYKGDVKSKMRDRLFGVIIGSILFPIIYSLFPDSMKSTLGIISGLLLGLCTQYKYSSLINCLGALLMASTIYGVVGAPIIRIINNVIGCFIGIGLYYLYYAIIHSKQATVLLKKLDQKIFKE